MSTPIPAIIRCSIEDYVADRHAPEPSLSASIANVLLSQSAQHARLKSPRLAGPEYIREDREEFDIGTIAHALVLENDGSRIVEVDAPDWRTKAAKEARDAARAAGKLPVLAHKMARVRDLVAAARNQITASELGDLFRNGAAEQTLLWRDEPSGVYLRARPDWLSGDSRVVFDLKTCDHAEPDAWARGQMASLGFDLQAVLALRGVTAILAPRDCTFVFGVIEVDPPHAMSFVSLSPAYLHFANERLDHAIRLWRMCLDRDEWPGYPSRICYAEPPAWKVGDWQERQTMSGANAGEGVDAL